MLILPAQPLPALGPRESPGRSAGAWKPRVTARVLSSIDGEEPCWAPRGGVGAGAGASSPGNSVCDGQKSQMKAGSEVHRLASSVEALQAS